MPNSGLQVSAIIIAFGAVTASLFAKDTCGNVLLNLNPDHGGVSVQQLRRHQFWTISCHTH